MIIIHKWALLRRNSYAIPKKHKTTKISLIIDDFNNPIAVGVYKSTIHDSKIIKSQLDDLYKESPILFDNNKTLVGDSAYDSKSLEEKITNLINFL